MLTLEETVVLEFERSWWLRPGAKDQTIEFELGLTSHSYYEMLLDLIGRQEAYVHDPLTVRRVRGILDPLPEYEAVG